jgi:hypothetical protein
MLLQGLKRVYPDLAPKPRWAGRSTRAIPLPHGAGPSCVLRGARRGGFCLRTSSTARLARGGGAGTCPFRSLSCSFSFLPLSHIIRRRNRIRHAESGARGTIGCVWRCGLHGQPPTSDETVRKLPQHPQLHSWGFFNFGLCRSARPLPHCYSFTLASRGKRDIKTQRDLLLRRRLTLKIPQLKLGVLREFSHSLVKFVCART